MIQVIETSVVIRLTLPEAIELKANIDSLPSSYVVDVQGDSNELAYLHTALEQALLDD